MDYIRQLGPVVLDHRFRRLMEALLRTAQNVYDVRDLEFRSRWASTFQLLHGGSPLAVGEIAARLRLTHPGVIGITDEMISAGIVRAVRDEDDARRRMIALTPKGRRMAPELFRVWKELGAAQRERFLAAGCDILPILDKVDDGLEQRSLAEEVIERLSRKSKDRSLKEPGRKSIAKGPARRARAAAARSFLLLAVCGFGGVAVPAYAQSGQQTSTPSPQLTAVAKEAVISALTDTLIAGYIYEKTARMLADTLRAELKAGAFDCFATGDSFAERVTTTLRRISNDRHLGLHYGGGSAEAGPVLRRVPRSSGTIQTGPATPRPQPSASATPTPRRVRVSESGAYGFGRAEILPGNIGYLELPGFSGSPEAVAVADSIMKMFANVKALIIDVGQNRGGGPEMVRYLSSYLFDKPTHLVSTFARGMDGPSERRTSERVGGKRLPNTPVIVLTSKRTISAAESFAFGLKVKNRITIVGERTAGGGHFGGFVSLPEGFRVFLPRGRTYDPKTNQGWEAQGLKPDVEVKYEDALRTATELIKRR
ncbi:MAG TPA: S41 family peptidase [Gemmatimonadaceae bacterium]|nr:S41 family peptidase [Gemmatimonadaceae bacterium]